MDIYRHALSIEILNGKRIEYKYRVKALEGGSDPAEVAEYDKAQRNLMDVNGAINALVKDQFDE